MEERLTSVGFDHVQKNKWLRIRAVLIALIVLTLGQARPTFADGPTLGPEGELLDDTDSSVPVSSDAQALNNARLSLLADYNAVKAGTMTMSTYNSHLDAFLQSRGISDTARHHPDRPNDCAPDGPSNCADRTESFGTTDTSAQYEPDAAMQERRIL